MNIMTCCFVKCTPGGAVATLLGHWELGSTLLRCEPLSAGWLPHLPKIPSHILTSFTVQCAGCVCVPLQCTGSTASFARVLFLTSYQMNTNIFSITHSYLKVHGQIMGFPIPKVRY